MAQLISEPTRVTQNSHSLIDDIVVTCPSLIAKAGVCNCPVSDHDHDDDLESNQNPVYKTIRSSGQVNKYDFSNALVEFNLDRMLHTPNIEEDVLYFNTIF